MMPQLLLRRSIVFSILATVASASLVSAENSCQVTNGFNAASNPLYYKATHPTLNADHIADLPGFTRSVYERDHALIAPESHVYGAMEGWTNSLGAILVTPAMGAQFVMYIAKMGANGSAGPPMLPEGTQRLVFVLSGEAEVKTEGLDLTLAVDHFVYFPPAQPHTLTAGDQGCVLVVIERLFEAWPDGTRPTLQYGVASDRPVLPVPGEVFALRKLLPTTPPFDFNIHIMDFEPGEFLNVKEMHYNQHVLLMLEGQGIYRLSDKWYPVQSGDVIWMPPFVPQWYAALGKSRTRYFLYKDVNRNALLG